MQGRQEYQPELFSIVDIEKLIPKNHLLRKIDRAVDFSFIREMTAPLYCQDNGRPSVDPETFFRIQLLIYFYNIESDRKACEEISYNLAYRWFCRLSLKDEVPDHSSCTKIMNRLGEETFKKIFEHIVKLCMEKGLAKGEKIMADGSLIKADAALNSLVEKKDGDTEEDIQAKEPPKYIIGNKYSNDTHVSKTDPDCRLAGKIGEPKQLRYKAHNIADRESRVIFDTHVTDGSVPEGTIFLKRLDEVERIFGINVLEAVADRGYGYGENLEVLESRKINSYIPNFHEDVGDNYDRNLFKYDEKNDKFICSMGHELLPANIPSYLEYNMQMYRLLGGHCTGCPMQVKCFKGQKVTRGKRIARNIYWRVQAKTKEREKTEEFRKIRGERQWKMEGIFAEAKNYHGLERARYRRRHKMQIQAYMIASVQNLKRLMGALSHIFGFWLRLIPGRRKNILSQIFA